MIGEKVDAILDNMNSTVKEMETLYKRKVTLAFVQGVVTGIFLSTISVIIHHFLKQNGFYN